MTSETSYVMQPISSHLAYSLTNVYPYFGFKLSIYDSRYKLWCRIFKDLCHRIKAYGHITDITSLKTQTDKDWLDVDTCIKSWFSQTCEPNLLKIITNDKCNAKELWDKLTQLFTSNKTQKDTTKPFFHYSLHSSHIYPSNSKHDNLRRTKNKNNRYNNNKNGRGAPKRADSANVSSQFILTGSTGRETQQVPNLSQHVVSLYAGPVQPLLAEFSGPPSGPPASTLGQQAHGFRIGQAQHLPVSTAYVQHAQAQSYGPQSQPSFLLPVHQAHFPGPLQQPGAPGPVLQPTVQTQLIQQLVQPAPSAAYQPSHQPAVTPGLPSRYQSFGGQVIGYFQHQQPPQDPHFYMDSGASLHMTFNQGTISSLTPCNSKSIMVGNGAVLPVHATGHTFLPFFQNRLLL